MNEIVDLSRPKILNHVIKGALFGLLSYRLGEYALECPAPWNYLLGVVVWILAAGCLRNMAALVALPRLELRRDAIRLRFWKPTRAPSWAMFLPFNRIVDVVIPWSDFDGCRTRIITGDPWDWWERLYIDTTSYSHEIGWDVFARSVRRLRSEIDAYCQTQLGNGGVGSAAVADFNSRRFAQPVQLRWKQRKASGIGCAIIASIFLGPLMVVAFGAIGVMVMMGVELVVPFACNLIGMAEWADKWDKLRLMDDVAFANTKAPLSIVIGAVGGVVFFVGLLLCYCLMEWAKARTRILQLEPDGLAFGRKPHKLRVIPWRDVLTAQVMTQTERTYFKDGSHSDTTTSHLEVQVRNGSTIVLPNQYGRSLADLSELIDPPPYKVALARTLMAQGTDIETAAVSAGLPST